MSARLSLPTPVKLNLFLHTLGRRDDGYRGLRTLFQFLGHGDELHLEVHQDGQVRLHTEIAGAPHDSNLIACVARGLQEASGNLQGVDIWLDKHSPMGDGIGGGGSDAAMTLLVLNHLWQLGWGEGRIAVLGLRLGADVLVLTRGRVAFVEGVGEKLILVGIPEL